MQNGRGGGGGLINEGDVISSEYSTYIYHPLHCSSDSGLIVSYTGRVEQASRRYQSLARPKKWGQVARQSDPE